MKIVDPYPGESHRMWTKRLAKINRTTRRRVLRYQKKVKRVAKTV